MVFEVQPVSAAIYYSETTGSASTSVEFGAPYKLVGEYAPHTLRLGVNCIDLGIGTASGSMRVFGKATTTGTVTGTVCWYMKGILEAVFKDYMPLSNDAWITVKFRVEDLTDNAWYETELMHQHGNPLGGPSYDGEYTGSMFIPLYQGHFYSFILDVKVHAEAIGVLIVGIADFGGVFWSDSRVEWRWIDVPNINIPPLTPSTPSGRTSGVTYETYTYSTSATDPDNDNLLCWCYWGDGSYDGKSIASGTAVSFSHYWRFPGTYYVKTRVQDIPYWQWSFDYSPSLEVTIRDSGNKPPGGGGCPILYVFNGTEYVRERLLNLHSQEGNDMIFGVKLEQQLSITPGERYQLRLVEQNDVPDSHSFIDCVRLYVVNDLGKTEECQLKFAVHSNYGNVKQELEYSDDIRTDTLPNQIIDLSFKAPNSRGDIQYLIFEIEGYNPKR